VNDQFEGVLKIKKLGPTKKEWKTEGVPKGRLGEKKRTSAWRSETGWKNRRSFGALALVLRKRQIDVKALSEK